MKVKSDHRSKFSNLDRRSQKKIQKKYKLKAALQRCRVKTQSKLW